MFQQVIFLSKFEKTIKQTSNLYTLQSCIRMLTKIVKYMNKQIYLIKIIPIITQRKKELVLKLKRANPQIDSILRYFCSKLGRQHQYEKYVEPNIYQNQDVIDTPIKQHQIKPILFQSAQTFQSVRNKQCFFKILPLEQKQQSPFLLINSSILYQQELRIMICALANSNKGFGSILVVEEHRQNIIYKGISKYTKNDLKNLEDKVKKAVKSITFEQQIKIFIDFLPILDYQNINIFHQTHNNQRQFAIRINVITKFYIKPTKHTKKLFFIEHRIKKEYKPFYIFGKLEKIGNNCLKFRTLISDQIYTQICKSWIKVKFQQKILRIHQLIQSKQQITLNCNEIIDYIKSNQYCILQKNQSNNFYAISNQPDKFSFSLSKIFMQNYFENQIPTIRQNQTVIAISINERHSVIEIIRKIQNLFKSQKIRYSLIIPSYKFQSQLSKLRNKQNPNIATYLTTLFIFEGKFDKLSKIFQKQYKSLLGEALTIELVSQKICLGMILETNEYNWYNEVIFQKYTLLPLIKKQEFQKENKIIYKNIQIKFDKTFRDAAVYTYLYFQFMRKRPKCIA